MAEVETENRLLDDDISTEKEASSTEDVAAVSASEAESEIASEEDTESDSNSKDPTDLGDEISADDLVLT